VLLRECLREGDPVPLEHNVDVQIVVAHHQVPDEPADDVGLHPEPLRHLSGGNQQVKHTVREEFLHQVVDDLATGEYPFRGDVLLGSRMHHVPHVVEESQETGPGNDPHCLTVRDHRDQALIPSDDDLLDPLDPLPRGDGVEICVHVILYIFISKPMKKRLFYYLMGDDADHLSLS
jgi:hypothetical protein